jgi:hypothetical protein
MACGGRWQEVCGRWGRPADGMSQVVDGENLWVVGSRWGRGSGRRVAGSKWHVGAGGRRYVVGGEDPQMVSRRWQMARTCGWWAVGGAETQADGWQVVSGM